MKILVSGSLAYDRIMNFDGRFKDHILPDKIHMLNVSFYVKTFRQSYGGTSGNIAYNLALLGEKPYTLGTYGYDFGDYKKWCRRNGINTVNSKQIKLEPTASVYIITDKSDNQIAGFFAGAMQSNNGNIPLRLLKQADMAIVAPGNPEDMKKYPVTFKKAKVSYFFDPGQQIPTLSKKDLISGITGAKAFISNDYELALVQKKTGMKLQNMLKKVEMIITTKGEKGSEVATKNKTYKIPPAKPVNTSDPTGAGDAYRAGFIKGLLAGYDIPKAGRLAAVVSVYTVEKYGTQTHSFTWQDIKKRYFRNFKEKI